MSETKIKACPFCGEPAKVEIRTLKEKEYYAIGCDNVACRGSAWAGDPDGVRALSRWNQRAGDRKPAMSKTPEPSTLASATGWASEVNAMAKRLLEIEEAVSRQNAGTHIWTNIHIGRLHIEDAGRSLGKMPNAKLTDDGPKPL